MYFDANCFVGNWPFFQIKENTINKLAGLHSRYQISGGFLSSLEAIFYQDPYEAEVQLSQQIKDTAYQHIAVLNPTLPAWKDDLINCVEKLGVTGVRLMPGFHGYSLMDPILDDVVSMIKRFGLHFMITLRMQDDRSTWMIHPKTVPMEDIAVFVDRYHDLPIMLNHIRHHEIIRLYELGVNWGNIYVDTSGFKDGGNPIENVLECAYLKNHILYGSGAPILEPYATILQLQYAHMDKKEKEQILTGENYLIR